MSRRKKDDRHKSEHPQECPITGAPFFMTIEHPERGMVATYGGPFDSYTIPEVDDDGELIRERYDHDAGHWVDGCEGLGLYVVKEEELKPPQVSVEPSVEGTPSDPATLMATARMLKVTGEEFLASMLEQAASTITALQSAQGRDVIRQAYEQALSVVQFHARINSPGAIDKMIRDIKTLIGPNPQLTGKRVRAPTEEGKTDD